MDHFGIGQAMRGMALSYTQAARRTGRTTSLVESLKDGDRVCCFTTREADRLRQLCRERNLKVDCIVVPIANPGRVFERGTSEGRTIFDHTWLENYYMLALERCQSEIDHLQREASGYGTAHGETKRQAIELSKWRV